MSNGSRTVHRIPQARAAKKYKKLLAEYERPPFDPEIDEALLAFIKQRKASFEDSNI